MLNRILLSALCAAALSAPAYAQGEVNVYSYREHKLIAPLLDAFTKDTEIKVNVISASSGLEQRIKTEGANSPADLLLSVDIARLQEAENLGITQPIKSDAVDKAIAPQYRDVNFIIPHLGSFNDDWRAQQQVVDQLVRWPNVYADTSGVRRFDYLVQATRRAGPNKLLFGSDGPWLHPAVELHKIKLLGLPRSEEELVTGHNVLRLIGEM